MERLSRIFGSDARLKLLRLFLFNQQSAFPLRELAERTGLNEDAVRRELSDILQSGLVRKKRVQSQVRYGVNPRFEHLNALERFIRETTSVQPKRIMMELRRAGTLRLVALSGLFTGMVEPQIDLLVVGDGLDERRLARTVRVLEAELGREIRYASFATADFRYRKGVYDRLLRDVFDYPHRLLVDKIGV